MVPCLKFNCLTSKTMWKDCVAGGLGSGTGSVLSYSCTYSFRKVSFLTCNSTKSWALTLCQALHLVLEKTVINKWIPNYDNWECWVRQSSKSLRELSMINARSILDAFSNRRVLIKESLDSLEKMYKAWTENWLRAELLCDHRSPYVIAQSLMQIISWARLLECILPIQCGPWNQKSHHDFYALLLSSYSLAWQTVPFTHRDLYL